MRFEWLRKALAPRDRRSGTAEDLWLLSDRDLRDLGLSAPGVSRFSHAPVDVGNDRV